MIEIPSGPQAQALTCPDGASIPQGYEYDITGEKYYKFGMNTSSISDATAICNDGGATLFMGKTDQDWDFVLNHPGEFSVFTGYIKTLHKLLVNHVIHRSPRP